MNSSVADRLNVLLKASEPVIVETVNPPANYTVADFRHSGISSEALARLVTPILKRNDNLAQEEEVRRAAKEKRFAQTHWTEYMGQSSDQSYLRDHGYAAVLWEISESEVRAAIAADNERRLKAYEEYRTFCEQGTAKPIPEASK